MGAYLTWLCLNQAEEMFIYMCYTCETKDAETPTYLVWLLPLQATSKTRH